MVFGKGYDNSLWLMIATDKKNREEIVKFVKNIPLEIYNILHEKIAKYKYYTENRVKFEDRDEKHICGQQMATNGVLYRYSINSNTGALEIVASAFYDNIESVDFSITLFPYEDYSQLDFLECEYIGDFSCESCTEANRGFKSINSNSIKYRLLKTSFGYMVYYSSSNSLIKNKSKGVNLRRMPSEMDVQELSSTKRVNELIRSRKRI